MRPGYAYTEMCQQALQAALPQAQPCFPKVSCGLLTQPNNADCPSCPMYLSLVTPSLCIDAPAKSRGRSYSGLL